MGVARAIRSGSRQSTAIEPQRPTDSHAADWKRLRRRPAHLAQQRVARGVLDVPVAVDLRHALEWDALPQRVHLDAKGLNLQREFRTGAQLGSPTQVPLKFWNADLAPVFGVKGIAIGASST